MNYTIFDMPVIKTLACWFSRFILKLLGWKAEGRPPEISKYVMTAAPHTSNWDFIYMLLIAFSTKIKIYAMAKKELFRWPFGYFFKFMGAIPIDRGKSNNIVSRMIQTFNEREELILVIPPSGTRKKVMYWKSGFYHISKGADVPIVLGYIDYQRKAGGFGPVVRPSGNIEKDMKIIRQFYSGITAKYPEKAIEASVPELAS